MAKLQPYNFGSLPVEAINGALGLELCAGSVVMSVNAQKHVQRKRPVEFAELFPHVATIVTEPLYVGDDFRNKGKIELVGKAPGLPDWLLVAIEIAVDKDGRYNIASFYPISEQKLQNRRDKGHYSRAILV